MRARHSLAGLALAGLIVASAACTADTDDAASGSGDGASDSSDGGAAAVGVTDDTVRLGVLGIDDAQLAGLGIEADVAPAGPLMEALVAAQNERGGAAGREIELAFEPFLPVGQAEAEAACVALTEDDPVFLAIGIMTGDTPLCFTEDHDTPYLGLWGLSPERARRSTAPFVAVEMADDRQRLAGIEALQAEGLLDGSVALYWAAVDTPMIEESVLPAIEDAGIEVVVETTLEDFGADQAAQDQAADVLAERIRSSGADTVLTLSGYAPLVTAFERAGWLPDDILSTTQQGLSADYNTAAAITPDALAHVTIAGQYKPSHDDMVEDPELAACIDEYNASGPEATIDAEAASPELLASVAQMCAAFRVFVQAADAAGDDLTADSWLAGAESLGQLELPGIAFGSLGEDKHSVNDGIGVYTYDAASGAMLPTGPAAEAGV
jgi:DNA-binding ferritin-like protein